MQTGCSPGRRDHDSLMRRESEGEVGEEPYVTTENLRRLWIRTEWWQHTFRLLFRPAGRVVRGRGYR